MISAGILPSGFCCRSESLASVGSAFSIVTSGSRPRMPSASFTLRPNGEGGEERRIIMGNARMPEEGLDRGARRFGRAGNSAGDRKQDARGNSAGDDQIDGLRTLA